MKDDVISTAGTIDTLTVRRIAGNTGPFFNTTTVTAGYTGKVLLRNVSSFGGAAYGITARSVRADSRYDGRQLAAHFTNLGVPADAGIQDQVGDYRLDIELV